MMRLALLVLAIIAMPAAASAERLIVSVSNQRITVNSSYSGQELVLFGAIEREADMPSRQSAYDLVVTVSGPRVDLVTRRKERRFGIWVNNDARPFLMVPSYLAVFANRPFADIAQSEVARSRQIGIANIVLTQRVGTDYADVVATDAFRAAFVRLREERGLYREASDAVTFLTPTLFRTGIPLPAEVPIGDYNVDIQLFANGKPITRTTTSFEIVKVGFEQFVSTAAKQNGFLYGMVTVMIALMSGWMASIVFRRD